MIIYINNLIRILVNTDCYRLHPYPYTIPKWIWLPADRKEPQWKLLYKAFWAILGTLLLFICFLDISVFYWFIYSEYIFDVFICAIYMLFVSTEWNLILSNLISPGTTSKPKTRGPDKIAHLTIIYRQLHAWRTVCLESYSRQFHAL